MVVLSICIKQVTCCEKIRLHGSINSGMPELNQYNFSRHFWVDEELYCNFSSETFN